MHDGMETLRGFDDGLTYGFTAPTTGAMAGGVNDASSPAVSPSILGHAPEGSAHCLPPSIDAHPRFAQPAAIADPEPLGPPTMQSIRPAPPSHASGLWASPAGIEAVAAPGPAGMARPAPQDGPVGFPQLAPDAPWPLPVPLPPYQNWLFPLPCLSPPPSSPSPPQCPSEPFGLKYQFRPDQPINHQNLDPSFWLGFLPENGYLSPPSPVFQNFDWTSSELLPNSHLHSVFECQDVWDGLNPSKGGFPESCGTEDLAQALSSSQGEGDKYASFIEDPLGQIVLADNLVLTPSVQSCSTLPSSSSPSMVPPARSPSPSKSHASNIPRKRGHEEQGDLDQLQATRGDPQLSEFEEDNSEASQKKKRPKKIKSEMGVSSPSTNYVCKECKKCFTRLASFTQHKLIHNGDRMFDCPVEGCTKKFTTSSNAKRHLKVHRTKDF